MLQTKSTNKNSNDQLTLDQRRARHAWNAVEQIVKAHSRMENGKRAFDATAKEFGRQAKRLPMRILSSGLGQALAFLYGKKYAPDLLHDLGDWVLDKRRNHDSTKPRPSDDALLREIIESRSETLRCHTDETLLYLQWLNRFAEAEGLTKEED